MKYRKKREKIYTAIGIFSIWLLVLNYMINKKEVPWKLLFVDINAGIWESLIEILKLMITSGVLVMVSVGIISLFVTGKIKVSIKVRLGKTAFKIMYRGILRKYSLAFLCLSAFLTISGILCFNLPAYLRSQKEWKGDTTIAHAGGQIEKDTYTNSPEAIHKNYAEGHRTFEIDMVLTSDNKLACIHDWDMDFQKGRETGVAPTSEEFLSYPIQGKYTAILFEDLCKIMNEYPDMWLVTDSKYDGGPEMRYEFEEMVRVVTELGMESVLDRVIVQIYNENMYDRIMEIYPFHSWIFTLYQRWNGDLDEFKKIARFCVQKDIQNITMNKVHVSAQALEIAENYRLDVYAHTINELEEAQDCMDLGVKGVYTDKIVPNVLGTGK